MISAEWYVKGPFILIFGIYTFDNMPKQINSHEHYKINRSRKGNKLKLKIIPSNFLSSNISHKHLENDFDVDDYGDRKRDNEDDTSTTSSKMIREITYVFGSNFSLNNQCEYRIKIYVTNTVIIQEQFLVDIQTNIFDELATICWV